MRRKHFLPTNAAEQLLTTLCGSSDLYFFKLTYMKAIPLKNVICGFHYSQAKFRNTFVQVNKSQRLFCLGSSRGLRRWICRGLRQYLCRPRLSFLDDFNCQPNYRSTIGPFNESFSGIFWRFLSCVMISIFLK